MWWIWYTAFFPSSSVKVENTEIGRSFVCLYFSTVASHIPIYLRGHPAETSVTLTTDYLGNLRRIREPTQITDFSLKVTSRGRWQKGLKCQQLWQTSQSFPVRTQKELKPQKTQVHVQLFNWNCQTLTKLADSNIWEARRKPHQTESILFKYFVTLRCFFPFYSMSGTILIL